MAKSYERRVQENPAAHHCMEEGEHTVSLWGRRGSLDGWVEIEGCIKGELFLQHGSLNRAFLAFSEGTVLIVEIHGAKWDFYRHVEGTARYEWVPAGLGPEQSGVSEDSPVVRLIGDVQWVVVSESLCVPTLPGEEFGSAE